MFIKNQTFKDEDTLLEMLFDFALGEQSELIKELYAGIDKGLAENKAYQDYYKSLPTQDDKDELEADERDLRLGEILMERFDAFEVYSAQLFGSKAGERTLLCFFTDKDR